MPHLDVYRTADGHVLLDCQADFLAHLNSRLVVPLLPEQDTQQVSERLNPRLMIEGNAMIMKTHFTSAVPVRELHTRIASLTDQAYVVQAALDMLISGY